MNSVKKYVLFFLCLCSTCAYAQNITVVGIGRLGLCFALCLEKAGYNVLGVDVSEDYVSLINSKEFASPEPHVSEYLKSSQNFRATTSIKEGIEFSDLYFITVPTNSIPGIESYDHSIVSQVLTDMNSFGLSNKHIVICATVFPGYIRNTANGLIGDCHNTTISYNPEFIAQGNIIHGIHHPDMVLIGSGSEAVSDVLLGIYSRLCESAPFYAVMSPESAEITKLALNCFITSKIAFANLIGDIADETPGADKYAILNAIGKDERIGSRCLYPGYGFGGPCFPRDNRALGNYAITQNIEPLIFLSTDQTNDKHAEYMARKLLDMNLDEYLFEDVAYKPNCPVPIIEASQKLEVAKRVAMDGKRVVIKDREEVLFQVQKSFGDLFEYITVQ